MGAEAEMVAITAIRFELQSCNGTGNLEESILENNKTAGNVWGPPAFELRMAY